MGNFNIFWAFRLKFTAWLQFYCPEILHSTTYSSTRRGSCVGKIFKDEEWFDYTRCTSSQNSRIWSAENLHAPLKKLQHSSEIGVLFAAPRQRIGKPFLFEKTIAPSEKLSISLAQFVAVLGQRERDCWLQQYGASTLSLQR
jgi:hypothetical protein